MFNQVSVNFNYNIGDKIYFIDEFNSVHQGKIIALCHGPLAISEPNGPWQSAIIFPWWTLLNSSIK